MQRSIGLFAAVLIVSTVNVAAQTPAVISGVRAAIAAMGRQFLHAARLGFHHPRTGEWMSFDAPPPPELARLLEELEKAVSR